MTVMKIDNKEYEYLKSSVVSCYIYEEGEDHEFFILDWINGIDIFLDDEEEGFQDARMKDGRKHWLISPVKPKGTIINKDNRNIVKWVVDYGPQEDLQKEWDFDNHCVKTK